MSEVRSDSLYPALDPMERISEVLFGLIMVLTYTGTLSVVTADRIQIRTMLIGALGCNLAWGIIDAGMYLMSRLHERGGNIMILRSVRDSTDPEAAQTAIGKAGQERHVWAAPGANARYPRRLTLRAMRHLAANGNRADCKMPEMRLLTSLLPPVRKLRHLDAL